MDTVASNRITTLILGVPDAIPHTAIWKQKPYFDEKESHYRNMAMLLAEDQFELLAACMTLDLEVPIHG